MNSLGITGLEQIFFGLFLIAHGSIYVMFLFHFLDKEKNEYLGWSGQSWILSKVINEKFTNYIGKALWLLTILLFVLSGLSVLDLLVVNELLSPLIILSSIIGILVFFVLFDGLSPTPYNWILGVVINLVLIAFVIFFSDDVLLLLAILIIIFLYGVLFHSRIISQMTGNSSKS
ncbi:MAG: hypothetical protein ACW981_04810 [Candidatus Hodarchaeales archaeon]|jgi:hypothetical protein